MDPGRVLVHRRGGEALVQFDVRGATALATVAHDARSAGGLRGRAGSSSACRVVVAVALCLEAVEVAARRSIKAVKNWKRWGIALLCAVVLVGVYSGSGGGRTKGTTPRTGTSRPG